MRKGGAGQHKLQAADACISTAMLPGTKRQKRTCAALSAHRSFSTVQASQAEMDAQPSQQSDKQAQGLWQAQASPGTWRSAQARR